MKSTFFYPPVYRVDSNFGGGFAKPNNDGTYHVWTPVGDADFGPGGAALAAKQFTQTYSDVAGQLYASPTGDWVRLSEPTSSAYYDTGYLLTLLTLGAMLMLSLHVLIRGASGIAGAMHPRKLWESML